MRAQRRAPRRALRRFSHDRRLRPRVPRDREPMRVLAIVQAWNEQDPVRGFTVRWMEALAARVEHLTVLANEQRQQSTSPDITVHSLGREYPHGLFRKITMLRRWPQPLTTILDRERTYVISPHMTPVYSE